MSFSFVFNEDTCERVQTTETFEAVPRTPITVHSYERLAPTGEDRLVFDLIGAPAPYANALRRALLSWVPSIAIELVSICDNNGIMPDEILAHRLGLVPINADPQFLDFPTDPVSETSDDAHSVLLFGLHVIGGDGPEPSLMGANATWEGHLPAFYTGPSRMVTSSHLVWLPFPGQVEMMPPAYPLHNGVPITKLRKGQRIELYARAVKGVGIDHAKFSPVCTACYRMVPRIAVSEDITAAAKKLAVESCPVGVFDIEDGQLIVARPRNCTSCRECLRKPKLAAYLRIGKEQGVFEFTVESVGVRPATTLVKEALQILQQKCAQLKGLVSAPAALNS
jgi:DNA-directed RNA polymerase I and III subunit RPAC1